MVNWLLAPAEDTPVSAHYNVQPTYLVQNHPHAVRDTLVKFKKKPANLQTPYGDSVALPVQAVVKFDFLVRR